MKRFLKILSGLAILAGGVAICILLWITRPEAKKVAPARFLPTVEYLVVAPETKQFSVPSQGIVEPARRTLLTAQVAGRVTERSPRFKPGQSVEEGEILLRIEDVDYVAALAEARAQLIDAEAAFSTEQARSAQARRDWEKLGQRGEAPELTLRLPQLRAAEARVESSRAAVDRAAINLERTRIQAPYSGIISRLSTEVGNYLTPGATLGELFQHSPCEVRLPVSVDDLNFLQRDARGLPSGEITLLATSAGHEHPWPARILRMEGEIDRNTRSAYLVAEVDVPDDQTDLPLLPGLFVEARLPGQPLDGITTLPFSAFTGLDRIAVIDAENRLRVRTVTIVHRQGNEVFVSEGLAPGERVCITEVPGLVDGMEVSPVPAADASAPAASTPDQD